MTARKSVTSSAASSLDALLENRPGSVRASTEAPLADLSIRPSSASSRALRSSVTRGSGTGGGFDGGNQEGENQPVRTFFSSDNISSAFSKPASTKSSRANMDYKLVFVTARDISDRRGLCGGTIKSSSDDQMCARRGCNIVSHSKKHPLLRENRVYLECTTKGNKVYFVSPSAYHYTMEYENDSAVEVMHTMLELINNSMIGATLTLAEACTNFTEFVDGITEALSGDESDHLMKLEELREIVSKMNKKGLKSEEPDDEEVSELDEGIDDTGNPLMARKLEGLTELIQEQGAVIAQLSRDVLKLTNELDAAKDIQRREIAVSTKRAKEVETELNGLSADMPGANWCHNIESKLYNLEVTGTSADPLDSENLGLIKGDMKKLGYEITLLKERTGDAIEVGDIKIRSVAEAFLFVNDHIETSSFSCFHDFVCLLDSLRSTDIDSSEYVRSEHDAMKAKLLDVQEVYISASFGHVAPLPFCRKSGTQEVAAQGSLGRALPLVKNRDLWYSMGGTIGLKKTMTKDLAGKVASLRSHIRFSLGTSLGAELALSYLESSHTCWKEFVAWTEDFYAELTGTSEVEPKEAWELILQCWLGFFNDLRDVRRECSSISATGLEVGSNARKEVVGRYIWTMGKAIQVQDEYLAKDFRNHPTISGVINYHLFLHRTPTTAFKKLAKKHDEHLHSFNDFKGKVERRLKKLEDKS